ncbi:MAG: hypothetical protein BEU00_00695 [Marine Group III euryarchaeote CG-Epi3]|jgi:hypothetical protein|uniref:Uncharacterized protein n=1 Tax=Marine Group III euryarchaeote CG-Epi3 TaxID=1888997 RepID=A0A1J5U357_9ARCH|nr:MAG: hypothetical protein BEU00_00695 [Marine Group III euryarchaeote CG-Epi3]|tara:strand:+ start:2507 stop:2932 length:426 start_codon:yes stop_codon:yes gene_type:complete
MNKEKKKESLQYLFEAATKIFGEKKLLEMLVAEGAPKDKNLEEIVDDEKLRFLHLTMALKNSEIFLDHLQIRLKEMGEIAKIMEVGNSELIEKWLSDECKPCLVEHVVEGYDEIYKILIELDDRLLWHGWPLIGKLHDPID